MCIGRLMDLAVNSEDPVGFAHLNQTSEHVGRNCETAPISLFSVADLAASGASD